MHCVLFFQVRTVLADFGVSIALLIMVATDYFIEDVFTDKLDVPDGLQVTDPSQRSWIINPLPKNTPLWIPFAAGIPALLLYLLLFMSTHICELLMMEKTNEKGAGVHWDIVLICACNCIGSFFGTPWICTSSVRSISHATSLTYTTNTTALKIASSLTYTTPQTKTTAIKDQRVSCLLVAILLGFSVLLSPVLKFIPYPVLFGMFLFMGITSLEGTQFFYRLCLILVPKKFHPHVTYVTRVGNISKPLRLVNAMIYFLGANLENEFVYNRANHWTWHLMGNQKFICSFGVSIVRGWHGSFEVVIGLFLHF